MSSTPTRVLAIVGLGFLLGAGHAVVRSAVMGELPIVLTRETAGSGGTGVPPLVQPIPEDTTAPPVATPPPGGTGVPPLVSSASDGLDAPVKPGSITLREALALHEQGAWFLDARHEEDFAAGHVSGAVLMPASRTTTPPGQNDLDAIPPGSTVVIYCTGGDCDASENTAIRLEQLQYEFDIRIMGKGYSDWADAGLPTESGAQAGQVEP